MPEGGSGRVVGMFEDVVEVVVVGEEWERG